jgi:hypothetical protein
LIRIGFLAAAALLATACAPQPSGGVAPDAPVQSADAGACATRGGTMQQVGRMQSWQCVIAYADAGKRCTDGDQCQGDCWAEDGVPSKPGEAAAGVCQPTSNRFGCHTTIKNGKIDVGLCID